VRHGEKVPVTRAHGDERAVVSDQAEGPADGRVYDPAGAARNVHGERDSVEESTRNRDRLACPAIQRRQLGVLTEAAGEQVDLAKLTDELATSTRKSGRIRDAENGGGSERA
jgi:hypothetical protein